MIPAPTFTTRDGERAKAYILDNLIKLVLVNERVSSATRNQLLPELCLAWVTAYSHTYSRGIRKPKPSDCRTIAHAAKALHREGLWKKVWGRMSSFLLGELTTNVMASKPWPLTVKYLKVCRLLLLCLQAEGPQAFYGDETLAVLTTVFQTTTMIPERVHIAGLARMYEHKVVKHLHCLWRQMFEWSLKSHWDQFTWVQVQSIAQQLGKIMVPLVNAVFCHIPSALYRSYGLLHLMERCLRTHNGASARERARPVRPTPLATYCWWAQTVSVTSALTSTLRVQQVPGREQPLSVVCGFVVDTCTPKRLYLGFPGVYVWDSRILNRVAELGDKLGLWKLACSSTDDFDVAEYQAQTRDAWDALAHLPMNAMCFQSALELQKRWEAQQLALLPNAQAAISIQQRTLPQHSADIYPPPEVVTRLVQAWRRQASRPRPSQPPRPSITAPRASARAAEEEAKRELPRDAEGLPVPHVQALEEDHGIHMEELEKAVPYLTDLANQFYDPVTMDLVQRCPVVVRLTNSELSSRAYERDEIVKWVHKEVRRQRAAPGSKATTKPLVKDPYGGGIIDLQHEISLANTGERKPPGSLQRCDLDGFGEKAHLLANESTVLYVCMLIPSSCTHLAFES